MLKVVRLKSTKEKYQTRTDINKMFDMIDVKGTEKERLALHLIDRATYKNELEVIDRFGDKISISNISTGCKAVIVILNSNEPVSTIECGMNALSTIFSLCDSGTVYVRDIWDKFPEVVSSDKVNIEIDGKKFESFKAFNDYWYNS